MSLARKVTVNASALAGSRIANSLIGIVGVGITTRYLGIDAFGALAAGLAFSSLLGVITDAGIWTITAREIARRPRQQQQIFETTMSLGFVLSVVVTALGAAVAFAVYSGKEH